MPRPAPVLNGGWRVEVIQVVDLATPSHAKPEEATRYPAELTPQVSSKHPITGSRLFSRSLVDCRLVPIAERPAEHMAADHRRLWSSRCPIGDRSTIRLRDSSESMFGWISPPIRARATSKAIPAPSAPPSPAARAGPGRARPRGRTTALDSSWSPRFVRSWRSSCPPSAILARPGLRAHASTPPTRGTLAARSGWATPDAQWPPKSSPVRSTP
jgi:hypothetical protein